MDMVRDRDMGKVRDIGLGLEVYSYGGP